MSGCDVIANWNDSAFSGESGRLDQLGDIVKDTMNDYGFPEVDVREQDDLMDSEGVPARYDPETNTIFFDSEYLTGDSITPDEAIYLAMHESIHAMDYWEDGSIDVGEAAVAGSAYGMAADETDDCQSEPPESGDGEGDTGGW